MIMAVLRTSTTILTLTFFLFIFSEARPFSEKEDLMVGDSSSHSFNESWSWPESNIDFELKQCSWKKKIKLKGHERLWFKYDCTTNFPPLTRPRRNLKFTKRDLQAPRESP
ncbi:hypothetical protein Pint_14393 [Pistacia integerrima]|uniref:Uncharacterized protein n=1 Tax=Pistacia integerrima TaxID=434235 RepID=A0ACC0Y7M3_9ROSI|nr:hypothetical protein Pint_14393 [Pistacia integerrima]